MYLNLLFGNELPEKISMFLDYALEKDEDAIINDNFVSVLYQAVQNNRYENVKQRFEEIKNNQKTPEMDMYEEVNSLSDMEEAKFESFINDLKSIKRKEGIIPEMYCDYLIKQKMNSESHLNKNIDVYFPIFKRAFEDKTRHVLMKNGLSDCCVLIKSDLGLLLSHFEDLDKSTLGVTDNKLIAFDENEVEDSSENKVSKIETLFHEVRHRVKNKHIFLDKKLSANEYRMLKEKIIRDEIPEYRERNYYYMYDEIDARIAGRREAYKYLISLGLSDKKILDGEGNDYFECFREKQEREVSNYNMATDKYVEEGRKEKFYIIFENLLEDKPELIKKYPILSIEFNDEGVRRTGFELLRSYEEALKEYRENPEKGLDNRFSIIPYILRESMVYYETIMKDVEELLKYETEDRIVKKYRNLIINEILQTYGQCKDEKKIEVFDNDSEEDKIHHFNTLVGNLYKFAKRNPTEDISQTILERIKADIPKEVKEEEYLKDIDNLVSAAGRQEGLNAIKAEIKGHEMTKGDNERSAL